MTLLDAVLVKVGLKTDVGAPVHAGRNPVYFTDVYPNENGGFTFAWRTDDHSMGSVEDHRTREEAEWARRTWTNFKRRQQNASFITEGV